MLDLITLEETLGGLPNELWTRTCSTRGTVRTGS